MNNTVGVSTTIPLFEGLTVQRATNASTTKPSLGKTSGKPPLEVSVSKTILEVPTGKPPLETSTTESTKDVSTETPETAELFSTPEGSVTPDWQHAKTHTDGSYEISVPGEITATAERSSVWRPYTCDNEQPLGLTRAAKDCHPPGRAQRDVTIPILPIPILPIPIPFGIGGTGIGGYWYWWVLILVGIGIGGYWY
ncbi:unnamed protein product [Rotaria magnacalcarata]|uniref:Uncharacterized protein n=2 Tax=Rotaria magnacalcarata TaxID=392030 RepID=A0A816TGZ1_9BILA|nr:unnamed protein product [Rotaria magnacalcarata]